MIVVNLDGLAYALSTWKYEGERDRLNMHQWRNSLVLWANPLGTLIRIKCLSHLFSVADRNNESLNIVFQWNPSPSRPERYCKIVHVVSYSPQKDNSRSNFKDIYGRWGGREWTKISQIKDGVLERLISSQVFTLRLYGYWIETFFVPNHIILLFFFLKNSARVLFYETFNDISFFFLMELTHIPAWIQLCKDVFMNIFWYSCTHRSIFNCSFFFFWFFIFVDFV